MTQVLHDGILHVMQGICHMFVIPVHKHLQIDVKHG